MARNAVLIATCAGLLGSSDCGGGRLEPVCEPDIDPNFFGCFLSIFPGDAWWLIGRNACNVIAGIGSDPYDVTMPIYFHGSVTGVGSAELDIYYGSEEEGPTDYRFDCPTTLDGDELTIECSGWWYDTLRFERVGMEVCEES